MQRGNSILEKTWLKIPFIRNSSLTINWSMNIYGILGTNSRAHRQRAWRESYKMFEDQIPRIEADHEVRASNGQHSERSCIKLSLKSIISDNVCSWGKT